MGKQQQTVGHDKEMKETVQECVIFLSNVKMLLFCHFCTHVACSSKTDKKTLAGRVGSVWLSVFAHIILFYVSFKCNENMCCGFIICCPNNLLFSLLRAHAHTKNLI